MKPGRRLCLMLLCLAALLTAVPGVNWAVNPYGAWPIAIIDRIYLNDTVGTRMTVPYRLRTEQPTTLLAGSSKVQMGMGLDGTYRDDVFNAGLPGASLDEIAAILDVARRGPRLRRVIWGVDFYAFGEDYAGLRDGPTRSRLEVNDWLPLKETLLSLQALEDSCGVLRRAGRGREALPPTRLLPVPWPQRFIREALESSRQRGMSAANEAAIERQMRQWVWNYGNLRMSARQMALFRETAARLMAAGIDLILFVPPQSQYEVEAIRQTGRWGAFQQWKRDLASTGHYWDFSGYNRLAALDFLFPDGDHFQPAGGQAILRRFLGQDCTRCGQIGSAIAGAAVWVDGASVERHLATQDAARVDQMEHDSPYLKLVAGVLSRSRAPTRTEDMETNGPSDGAASHDR